MKMKSGNSKKAKAQVSMKTKLVGVILPVVGVILAVLVIFSYTISSKIIERRSTELLESSVSAQSASIEAWLDNNLEAFKMTKQVIEQTAPNEEELQDILDSTAGYNSNYPEGMYVGDVTGKLWKPEASAKNAAGLVDSTWFREGLSRVSLQYGTAYHNEDGVPLVSASAILNDGAEDLRVISVDVSLQRIMVIVNSFVEMDDAEAFLVDSGDNVMLANRDESLIASKMEEADSDSYMAQVAEHINTRNFDQCIIDGNTTVFEEIAGTDWILVSFVPKEVIFNDIDSLRTKMILISILAVLILFVIIERYVHAVMQPMKNLTGNIVAMSEGNFTIDVKTGGRDEVGKISQSVADFVVAIKGMLREIRNISSRVAEQSENTNEVSGEMYHIAEVQAESMRGLNLTVEQLSDSISEIAGSATRLAAVVADTKGVSMEVEDYMNQTVEISEKGRQDMQKVSTAMENISRSIQNLDLAINKVGTASEEITNIVSVIGNIADETNLLSLNASIEAARAGEAGRGFAVVASEIGKLAQTSADSVGNIVELIEEITGLVKETVQQAQSSMESINESSGLINTALETFDSIFKDIHDTSRMIRQMMIKVDEVDEVASGVAAISEKQAASTEQIHTTSESMAEQAGNIASSSKNVLAGAQELSEGAVQLSEHLKKFKID